MTGHLSSSPADDPPEVRKTRSFRLKPVESWIDMENLFDAVGKRIGFSGENIHDVVRIIIDNGGQ